MSQKKRSEQALIEVVREAWINGISTRKIDRLAKSLGIDALYEKIRDSDRCRNMAIMVVKGINLQGMPHILAVEPFRGESEENYQALFASIKDRGLAKVWLCVSDAHRGLQNAIQKEFLGASWQRCKVHFMRNNLSKVSHKDKEVFAGRLKHIWVQPDRKTSIAYCQEIVKQYGDVYPEAIAVLEDGLEDSLQFYAFPEIDP